MAETVPMALAACLTTGNDLSVRGRGGDLSLCGSGGKLTYATTALSKFDLGNTGSTTGTTGTTFNIVRSNDGSSARARGASDDVGTATGSGHTLQCTTDTLGVPVVIEPIGGIKINDDSTIGTNCNAAVAAVNVKGTTPTAEAGTMQQRVKKKVYGHIGPDLGGPDGAVGPGVGQSVAVTEMGQILTGRFKTGNALSVGALGGRELSVRDRGGESIHAIAAALGKFDSTASDATKDQLDPLMNVEGKAKLIVIYL
jgi:hypothetical protein